MILVWEDAIVTKQAVKQLHVPIQRAHVRHTSYVNIKNVVTRPVLLHRVVVTPLGALGQAGWQEQRAAILIIVVLNLEHFITNEWGL